MRRFEMISPSPARPRTKLAVGTAVIALAMALASCAAEEPAGPQVDVAAASDWVAGVQAAESDGPGLAGSATLLASPADPDADPTDGEGSGVRLDFTHATDLVRADIQCYGGHTATIAVTPLAEGSAKGTSFMETIDCDEKPHELLLGPDGFAGAMSVLVQAEADPETYAYVALIERLTVEFE